MFDNMFKKMKWVIPLIILGNIIFFGIIIFMIAIAIKGGNKMKIKKSKTISAGDLISLKKDKICKVRKDTKKGPDGIYFSTNYELQLDMSGKIKSVYVPEHIKLKRILML